MAKWLVIDSNGKPVIDRFYTGPGRWHMSPVTFRTDERFIVGDMIDMIEPFGIRSRYKVIEAGKVTRVI